MLKMPKETYFLPPYIAKKIFKKAGESLHFMCSVGHLLSLCQNEQLGKELSIQYQSFYCNPFQKNNGKQI